MIKYLYFFELYMCRFWNKNWGWNFETRSDETVGKIFDGINKNWGQKCSSVTIATVVL